MQASEADIFCTQSTSRDARNRFEIHFFHLASTAKHKGENRSSRQQKASKNQFEIPLKSAREMSFSSATICNPRASEHDVELELSPTVPCGAAKRSEKRDLNGKT
jgi:hypothetical protein